MTLFRMDVSRETGAVMLNMEAACGFRPLIGWSSIDGVKEFATMLFDIYHRRNGEMDRIREISDNIIEQALGNDSNPSEEEPRSE